MITRISGLLEAIETNTAILQVGPRPPASPAATARPSAASEPLDLALEVLLPAYLAQQLRTRVGERVTLFTVTYLEGQGQGTSFVPRLVGFASPQEREFFDLFTTVRGIGTRKALRALALPVRDIADCIAREDSRALTALPEIGKRTAESIIVELKGKVDSFVSPGAAVPAVPGRRVARPAPPPSALSAELTGPQGEAVEALVRLGETRPEAERKVLQALQRAGADLPTVDRIISAVFSKGG